MNWEHRAELRADPSAAPSERRKAVDKRRSAWSSIMVVAAASVFGGVIWFAYQSGRDATRSGPPLIKAESGPVKIKPDNPGGQELPYQDSTVYDRLGQNGQTPAMEKLLPPPEAPVARPQPAPPAPPPETADISEPPPELGPTPSLPASSPDLASPTALAPLPGAIITQPPTAPRQLAVKPPPVPKAAQADPIAALEKKAMAELPPKPSSSGSYRVQLSAVRTSEAVAPEWARLKHRFPEILASLTMASDKIDIPGKGSFYRLRAGPLDQAGAKSACERLRSQGLGCIVVNP